MKTTELSRIEKSVLIQAPRARVWRALTEIAEFSKWFGVSTEGDIAPGARLKMTITIEGYEGMVFYMTVEEMQPMELFSWRWHPGAVEPKIDYSKEPTTLVEIRLRDEAGGTRVTVMEWGFEAISMARRAKVLNENTEGWEFELGNLEKYVRQSA